MTPPSVPDDLIALSRSITPWVTGREVDAQPHRTLHSLAMRHRVAGAYADAVGDRHLAEQVTARALGQIVETGHLHRALADLPHRFMKGQAVAALAYAQPTLKQAGDIDLLVLPDDLVEASRRIMDLGYARRWPAEDIDLVAWHAVSNQSIWTRADQLVELHDRCTAIPGLLTTLDAGASAQDVRLAPGLYVPTFCDEETFLHLVVHGASSGWFRLKWLADFAAFCHRREDRIDPWLELARCHRVGAAAASALSLAHHFFGLRLSEDAARTCARDRRAAKLTRQSLTMMARGEPTERALGTLPLHRISIALTPDLESVSRYVRNIVGRRRLEK